MLEIKHLREEDFEVIIEDDIFFKTDRTMLSIILTNLAENSFLYSKRAENQKVNLKFESKGGDIKICIMDYGIGIKKKIQDKIFTMFFRGSELSTGNGLGLYLVKTALDNVLGTIDLVSEE